MISRLSSVRLHPLSGACLTLLMLTCGHGLAPGASRAQGLFAATEVDPNRFVLVAAPIGSSSNRFQLNIYEQIRDLRPCFAVTQGVPAAVDPLLARFDFSGTCNRYIDANGYSLRIGNTDLATSYRLTVRTEPTGTVLVASPTRNGAGPELLLARSGGAIQGFHRLQPEPGWRLMRRTFGARRLGHLYLYSDAWPTAATVPAPTGQPPAAAAAAPAAPAAPTAPATPAAAVAPVPAKVVPPAAAVPAPSGQRPGATAPVAAPVAPAAPTAPATPAAAVAPVPAKVVPPAAAVPAPSGQRPGATAPVAAPVAPAAPAAPATPAAGMAVPPAAASPAPGAAAPQRGGGAPGAGSLSPISGGQASPPPAPPNL